MVKVIATIEARLRSSRLPGKVFYPLGGVPVLEHVVQRARSSSKVDNVVVATTTTDEDLAIVSFCNERMFECFQGSENDVSERLMKASEGYDVVVQLTADNPLIEGYVIDRCVEHLINSNADFVSNSSSMTRFPIGTDVRVFLRKSLLESMKLSSDAVDRAHGSYFIERNPQIFSNSYVDLLDKIPDLGVRLTLDEARDYAVLAQIFDNLFSDNNLFSLNEVITFLSINPDLARFNLAVTQKSPLEC